MTFSIAPNDWPIPEWQPREVLLEWVRSNAPDLRIVKASTPDGHRACYAGFSFRGQFLEVEAIESDEVRDPDDAIVRRCAWLIYRELGTATPIESARRRDLTQQVIAASQAGDATRADQLAHELALMNEGVRVRTIARAKWER